MIKKLFTLFIILAFCSNYAVFAADPDTVNLKRHNAFEDNQQELYNANYVKNISIIEKIYNSKENSLSGNVLYQVGYEQFKSNTEGPSSTGKYDSSYKLSIGDKLNVFSYGDSVDVISMSGSNLVSPKLTVDIGSNGSIFVPGVGLFKADGRTLGEVENEINHAAGSKYTNMKVKLQVASGGFTVFVYGEVRKPGKVYIGNNTSILDVLNAAGGVKKSGTLRNIKYNNKYVDLYNTLFLGNDNGIVLRPNDKIFVDKIKNTMAISNGVNAPGIYEFKTGETLGDIIKYAGDLLVTTQRDEVTKIGFDKTLGQKVAMDLRYTDAKSTKLSNGDTFQFRELYNKVENTVTLQGNVKHPATYAYKEGMRLSDVLKSEDELREETFIYQAVIRRYSGKNGTEETIPVYLKEFFSGMNDPILQPRDVVTIYKNTSLYFVDVYGCINTPKHIPYTTYMTLSSVMSDIQFMESDINSVNTSAKTEEEGEDSATKSENENVKMVASTENSNKLIPAENIAVEITDEQGKETTVYYLYDIMIKSDKIRGINLKPGDKIFFRTLRENEAVKNVKVSGFVKKPGVYSFVKGQKLSDVIEMAEGLDDEADLTGIVFRRTHIRSVQIDLAKKNNEKDIKLLQGRIASGYKQTEGEKATKLSLIEQLQQSEERIIKQYDGQLSLNIKSNDINKISKVDNILMQDGDEIYIPRKATYVSVIGEVYNEQAFVYTKGSSVRNYIKMVGGYTPNANKFRIYKVGVNGRAERTHLNTKVAAGDTIVVPTRIAGNDWLTPISQTIQGLANTMVMLFAIHKW